jgi:hypothetical protein
MSWRAFGRRRLWSIFKVLSLKSPGGTENNHENPQSGYRDLNEAGVLTTRTRHHFEQFVSPLYTPHP